MTDNQRGGRDGYPAESENLRNSGARKLEARAEGLHNAPEAFEADLDRAHSANSHLMEPVNENQGKTHTADGRNPSGSFGAEGEPSAALEPDPTLRSGDYDQDETTKTMPGVVVGRRRL